MPGYNNMFAEQPLPATATLSGGIAEADGTVEFRQEIMDSRRNSRDTWNEIAKLQKELELLITETPDDAEMPTKYLNIETLIPAETTSLGDECISTGTLDADKVNIRSIIAEFEKNSLC